MAVGLTSIPNAIPDVQLFVDPSKGIIGIILEEVSNDVVVGGCKIEAQRTGQIMADGIGPIK